jgi:hypothetical protein
VTGPTPPKPPVRPPRERSTGPTPPRPPVHPRGPASTRSSTMTRKAPRGR